MNYGRNIMTTVDLANIKEWIDNSEYEAEELFQMYFDDCLPDNIPEYVIAGLEHDIEMDEIVIK